MNRLSAEQNWRGSLSLNDVPADLAHVGCVTVLLVAPAQFLRQLLDTGCYAPSDHKGGDNASGLTTADFQLLRGSGLMASSG